MTCKGCRHWSAKRVFGFPSPSNICANPRFAVEALSVPHDAMGVMADDPYTEFAIETGPDFGCIQWEPR